MASDWRYRVLSLLPSTTEILYAIGAEDRLVGVTHECDWPPEVRTKPQVTGARISPAIESAMIDRLVREQLEESGSLYQLDLDLVRKLAPDIVLTQQLCTVCAVGYETVRAAMRSLDDPPEVVNVEPHTLDEVFASFVDVADRVGSRAAGEELVEGLRERFVHLQQTGDAHDDTIKRIPLQRYHGSEKDRLSRDNDRPRLLFLEWLIPPFSAGHWIPELVEAAGFVPVLANPGEASRQLDWETIAATEFDLLVVSCCGFSIERAKQDLDASDELADLLAKRPDLAVWIADGNHYFSRPGPRLVESAEALAEIGRTMKI